MITAEEARRERGIILDKLVDGAVEWIAGCLKQEDYSCPFTEDLSTWPPFEDLSEEEQQEVKKKVENRLKELKYRVEWGGDVLKLAF